MEWSDNRAQEKYPSPNLTFWIFEHDKYVNTWFGKKVSNLFFLQISAWTEFYRNLVNNQYLHWMIKKVMEKLKLELKMKLVMQKHELK